MSVKAVIIDIACSHATAVIVVEVVQDIEQVMFFQCIGKTDILSATQEGFQTAFLFVLQETASRLINKGLVPRGYVLIDT